LPVEEEDGIFSLVKVCQPHPLQDGVVDIEVTLPIRRLCNSVQLVTFLLEFERFVLDIFARILCPYLLKADTMFEKHAFRRQWKPRALSKFHHTVKFLRFKCGRMELQQRSLKGRIQ
jgi:hypothetical protein